MSSSTVKVVTNATKTHYSPYFVHKKEYIPSSDPRYTAGNAVENRVEPPPEEVDGDVFDRQRVIEGFHQAVIESQNCFVLGVGGVGQNVALALARLGVNKISLVDNDTYDPSNLTRQLLGSIPDAGMRKVDVSLQNLQFHNLRSELDGRHLDVLSEWPTVVEMAKSSHALFNCIDIGFSFDYAINSLSKALSLPLVQGQSAGWTLNAEFFSGQPGQVCMACQGGIKSCFAVSGSAHTSLLSRLTAWLSSQVPEAGAGAAEDRIAVSQIFEFLRSDSQYKICGPTSREIIAWASSRVESFDESTDSILTTNFTQFLTGYCDRALELLLPNNILALPDLQFIPRPAHIPTRFVGSWVCPAMGVAAVMVSQFTNYLTGPGDRNPPLSITLDLSTGLTDLCSTALECGFVDAPPRATDSSDNGCAICAFATSRLEEQLLYSLTPVTLTVAAGVAVPFQSCSEAEVDGHAPSRVQVRNGTLWRNIDDLGPDYVNLVLDAVPSVDLDVRGHSSSSQEEEAPLPDLLTRPLVKGRFCPSPYKAYASGVRSALLQDTQSGTWYRLKGCGMPDKGFAVADVLNDLQQPVINAETGFVFRKIRGAAYVHTCAIELQMSAVVDSIIASAGLRCANLPLGRWDYDLGADVEFPLVTRSSGLFVTAGDKRLGDHVLRGLELLLPILAGDTQAIRQSAADVLNGTGLTAMGMGREFSSEINVTDSDPESWEEYDGRLPRAMLLYAGGANSDPDLFSQVKPLASPLSLKELRGFKLPRAHDFPEDAPRYLRCVWVKNCEVLKNFVDGLESSGDSIVGSLLASIYWRCGRDAGNVSRALKANGLVWGAYSDATGSHMNAHANNFVLVIPSTSPGPSTALLAPLDFDMAYSRKTVDFGLGPEDNGKKFEQMAEQELSELVFNLAMTQSNRESSNTGTKPPVAVCSELGLARLALRDTLVKGWLTAVNGQSDEASSRDFAEKEAVFAILRLALILTANVIA